MTMTFTIKYTLSTYDSNFDYFNCLCVVLGIVGNLLTLVVLACQRLRAGAAAERKVNVWLQALAVSDLLLCVALLPHGLMTYGERLVYTSLSFQLLYQAYGAAVINNFILTSTWITVAMSFSRYMAVCHPLGTYHSAARLSMDSNAGGCTHVGTRIKAGVIFVACFLFNLPRFFENRIESHSCVLEPNGAQQEVFALNIGATGGPSFRGVYVWVYFGVAIVVPLVTLAFCNVQLVNALYQSRKMRCQHSTIAGKQTPPAAGTMVTITMIAIVLMYAILVAPGEILTCITKHLLSRYDE